MTAQSALLKLQQRIDPYTKAGVEITAATIGTVDGDRFTKQRLLDIYNEARMVLFSVMRQTMSEEEFAKNISALYLSASITFTFSTPDTTAPKPAAFMKLETLMSATASLPVIIMPNEYLEAVQRSDTFYTQSVTDNLIGFEQGTNFLLPAINAAGTGKIYYYGITDWALSDITTGTATEKFSEEYIPVILQLAQAIANEQGSKQVNALAMQLIGQSPAVKE